MRRIVALTLSIAVAGAALTGCGGNKEAGEEQNASTPATPSSSAGSATLPPDLDQGPRAAASEVDEAKAKVGGGLFQSKGCSACHGFGKRVSGPDLQGVSQRRTAKWLESQILHPDVMIKQDPIARGLFAQYSLQMPKQGLTEDEARAVIEFLKHKDHEAGEKPDTE
ncbi:MAG: cytochrome c [Candidatus Eisenbacteria bacterium]